MARIEFAGHARCLVLILCVMALALAGCAHDDEGLRVLASTECEAPLAAAVESEHGDLMWAGNSLYSFDRSSLVEVMGFSSDYSVLGFGFGNSLGALAGGITQTSDRRLVLVRQVRTDGADGREAGVFDHHELVATSLGDGQVDTEIILSAPEIREIDSIVGNSEVDLVCLSTDPVADTALLTAARVAGEAVPPQVWTREIAGRPQAWAVSDVSEETKIAVVGLVVGSYEPRLEIFSVQGDVLDQVDLQGGERPSLLYPYRDGEHAGWLIEWWEDEGNRLTLTFGNDTMDVTGAPGENDHNQLIAVGELFDDSPGDELIMNFGRADSGSRRAVVATLTDGQPRVHSDLASVSLSAARIVDINGDGLGDVLGVEIVPRSQQSSHRSVERVGVWLSDGQKLQAPLYSRAYDAGVASLDCGDLDGDGVLEVLVGYESASGGRGRVDVLKLR